jgi:hypothetical protein
LSLTPTRRTNRKAARFSNQPPRQESALPQQRQRLVEASRDRILRTSRDRLRLERALGFGLRTAGTDVLISVT